MLKQPDLKFSGLHLLALKCIVGPMMTMNLEIISGISLEGNQQHGFQKNKSTVTAGLFLQPLNIGGVK